MEDASTVTSVEAAIILLQGKAGPISSIPSPKIDVPPVLDVPSTPNPFMEMANSILQANPDQIGGSPVMPPPNLPNLPNFPFNPSMLPGMFPPPSGTPSSALPGSYPPLPSLYPIPPGTPLSSGENIPAYPIPPGTPNPYPIPPGTPLTGDGTNPYPIPPGTPLTGDSLTPYPTPSLPGINLAPGQPATIPPNQPIRLAPNWRVAYDAEGRMYYYHSKTRETQWEPPTEEEEPDKEQEEENETDEEEETSSETGTSSEKVKHYNTNDFFLYLSRLSCVQSVPLTYIF